MCADIQVFQIIQKKNVRMFAGWTLCRHFRKKLS